GLVPACRSPWGDARERAGVAWGRFRKPRPFGVRSVKADVKEKRLAVRRFDELDGLARDHVGRIVLRRAAERAHARVLRELVIVIGLVEEDVPLVPPGRDITRRRVRRAVA